MGSLSNFAEDALVNHLTNTAYTASASVFVALCTADPTDAGTGASMNETADAHAYARTAITFNAAATRRVEQSADIAFPQATGTYAAAITHWAIVDSATHGAGNMLAHGAFTASFTPVNGNIPRILTSLQEIYIQIDATAGAGFSDYAVHNLLNLMFRNVAFTSPANNTFVFLSNTVLDDQDVANTDFTEVAGTGYARQEVNPNGGATPVWAVVSAGATNNVQDIDFGTVGAGDWTQVVAAGLIDTLSGAGNVLAYDSANVVDQTPVENDTVKFAATNFSISLS